MEKITIETYQFSELKPEAQKTALDKYRDGQEVYFEDKSYTIASPAGTMYQWLWNFDDPLSAPNHTSTLQNPTHIFTPVASGGKTSYNVTLQVWENLQNCPSPVLQINVPINPPIPIEFTFKISTACATIFQVVKFNRL